MRDLISGKLFAAKKKMTDNFIASRVVRGGSRKVEQAMRKEAWDPLSPAAAVSVYLADPSGRVNAAKLVLAGVMPCLDIPDIRGIFPKVPHVQHLPKGSAQPIFMEKIKTMIGISPVPYNDL